VIDPSEIRVAGAEFMVKLKRSLGADEMTFGFLGTTALVATALLASACNMAPTTNAPPASNQAASAPPVGAPTPVANPDRYQVTLIRGSASQGGVSV
jgi:hypothetical protein